MKKQNLMKTLILGLTVFLSQEACAAAASTVETSIMETPFQVYQRTILANQTPLNFGDSLQSLLTITGNLTQ